MRRYMSILGRWYPAFHALQKGKRIINKQFQFYVQKINDEIQSRILTFARVETKSKILEIYSTLQVVLQFTVHIHCTCFEYLIL